MAAPSTEQPDGHGAEEPFRAFDRGRDWRVWFGIVVTLFWLLALILYVSVQIGWSHVGETHIDTVGSFLEGAFAPLAFLWFVLAFFSQQKELAQNTIAIKMQYVEIQKATEQAIIQSEAIRASEMHARKESFLRIADSVKEQLGAIMGFLYISSQSAAGAGAVAEDNVARLWAKMSRDDPEIFSRSMLQLQLVRGPRYGYKLLYGTAVRTRHSENFIFHFERMLRAAESCDEDGMIRDALLGTAHGYIYRRMVAHRDQPPAGFRYREYDFDPDSMEP